jgi:hypothetical protein
MPEYFTDIKMKGVASPDKASYDREWYAPITIPCSFGRKPGEANRVALRRDFDPRLPLQFLGPTITSDRLAGLLWQSVFGAAGGEDARSAYS